MCAQVVLCVQACVRACVRSCKQMCQPGSRWPAAADTCEQEAQTSWWRELNIIGCTSGELGRTCWARCAIQQSSIWSFWCSKPQAVSTSGPSAPADSVSQALRQHGRAQVPKAALSGESCKCRAGCSMPCRDKQAVAEPLHPFEAGVKQPNAR